ncbi:MAG: alpha-amylase [Acholeplasmatales bacterium]|nr:MAG: alpha-amylase [Acholeplasmatales bacterium]
MVHLAKARYNKGEVIKMAYDTPLKLRELFIYQVYVRNHTEAGTFKALMADLDRLKALGTDVVYLLPIHPIGEVSRKGTLGSPYAIKDYYAVNAELGTLDDFTALIAAIHERGMKVMMDIVFNHTSPDSLLNKNHPEYFYHKADGSFGNRVGDWWDIIDFDYTRDPGLGKVLIDVLLYWTKLGVDGYRFDVSSFLPLDFLLKARKAVQEVDPDTIWLSESVHGDFLRMFRNEGYEALSECELYTVFDLAYDYDTHPELEAYIKGNGSLEKYVRAVMAQEWLYPKNYVKLRNLENHDFGRIASMVPEQTLTSWHAFSFFNKGATMIFSGGEYSNPHHPSLFDKDPITREGKDLSPLIKTSAALKRDPLYHEGVYELFYDGDVLIGSYTKADKQALGLFNVGAEAREIEVGWPDGTYENQLNHRRVTVKEGRVLVEADPIWLVR